MVPSYGTFYAAARPSEIYVRWLSAGRLIVDSLHALDLLTFLQHALTERVTGLKRLFVRLLQPLQ